MFELAYTTEEQQIEDMFELLGLNVQHDEADCTAGWTEADWQAFAEECMPEDAFSSEDETDSAFEFPIS